MLDVLVATLQLRTVAIEETRRAYHRSPAGWAARIAEFGVIRCLEGPITEADIGWRLWD